MGFSSFCNLGVYELRAIPMQLVKKAGGLLECWYKSSSCISWCFGFPWGSASDGVLEAGFANFWLFVAPFWPYYLTSGVFVATVSRVLEGKSKIWNGSSPFEALGGPYWP